MSDDIVLSLVIPLIFLFCGSGLLTGGGVRLLRTRAFLSKTKETVGEIVALKKVLPVDSYEQATYRPVVSFRVGTSSPIRFESMTSSNPPQYSIGDSVPVLYDPGSPYDARIRSFTSLWLLPIVLCGLGLIFALIGAGILIGGIPS